MKLSMTQLEEGNSHCLGCEGVGVCSKGVSFMLGFEGGSEIPWSGVSGYSAHMQFSVYLCPYC